MLSTQDASVSLQMFVEGICSTSMCVLLLMLCSMTWQLYRLMCSPCKRHGWLQARPVQAQLQQARQEQQPVAARLQELLLAPRLVWPQLPGDARESWLLLLLKNVSGEGSYYMYVSCFGVCTSAPQA
jgi:hypothetical protein